MNSRNVLQAMIGMTLVALLLVGCGVPAATPTPVPPTITPTPSITGFGQAEEFGPWRVKVVNIDHASSIDIGSYEVVEGRTLCLVELD